MSKVGVGTATIGGAGSGLTDTQLRASPLAVDGSGQVQPVSGTFWPVTQPVSGTFWQATQPVSGTFWQATQPVSIASMPSTPVTGTFWQATQPVSGTFWQTTQPVSAASLPLPSGASTESTLSTLNGKVTACNTGAVVLAASSAVVGHVIVDSITPPTLTKGTQGATGYSVQPLRDAGRVFVDLTASAIATVTTEALITLTPYRDLVAGSSASTFAVTAGKKWRIQTIVVTTRCTSTVDVGGIVRVRMLAGTVLVGSPVMASLGCMGSDLATAVIGNAQSSTFNVPEGLELSGTMQIGLTQLFSATTATIDVHVLGYEY